LACFDEALRLAPQHAKAHFGRSLQQLTEGHLEEGFAEYEWRWRTLRDRPRAHRYPEWDGRALAGGTILISAEQGLGDTIQFARYLPLVAARGGAVIVESQAAAGPLIRRIAGVTRVMTADDPLPQFEARAELMSLPRIFGTNLENIPNSVPYISFEPGLAVEVEEKLGPRRSMRIGVAWSGNPRNDGDRRRSIPVEELGRLRSVPGVEYFSLHCGEAARCQTSSGGSWIRHVLSDSGGLMELAAMMSCLDLIVTVDTMAAHLAGSLARPVWNMLCYAPDWRWMKSREDSPWYPSMRLFRQSAAGDWRAVVERIARALTELAAQCSGEVPDTYQ
jgi:hypothetical protein